MAIDPPVSFSHFKGVMDKYCQYLDQHTVRLDGIDRDMDRDRYVVEQRAKAHDERLASLERRLDSYLVPLVVICLVLCVGSFILGGWAAYRIGAVAGQVEASSGETAALE